jgi:hypothetical protein
MNTPVIALRAVEQVSRIADVLQNMPHLHSGFPVVEDYDPDQVGQKVKSAANLFKDITKYTGKAGNN